MRLRQPIVLIFTAVLAGATALPNDGFGVVRGDVNGDRQVDVLDVQSVIGSMLSGTVTRGLADVNGDGRTDVLDLLLTLARAQGSAEEEEPSPEGSIQEACHFSYQAVSLAKLERCKETLAIPGPPQRVGRAFPKTRTAPSSCKRERYLYRLTPHAPPRCA